MADNHEIIFAEEAQEETIVWETAHAEGSTTRRTVKPKARSDVQEEEFDGSSEDTPLINSGAGYTRRQSQIGGGRESDRDDLPWYKRPSIWWLLPAFFPFCIAFGGLIVPRSYLVMNIVCKDYLAEQSMKDPMFHYIPVDFGAGENPQCDNYQVQQRVAYFNTYSDLISGILSAIVTAHVGALSDRVGRKYIMVLASFGGLANEIITIIVGSNPETVSIYWLLLGSFTDGITGSFTSGMALSSAYMADCTRPDKLSNAFGYFQGTLFTGIALGPLFASALIARTGQVMTVFYVALGCHLFFITFVLFLVPESLSKEKREIAREKHALARAKTAGNTWLQAVKKVNVFEPLWILRPTGEGSSSSLRRNLLILVSIDTMMFGVAMGAMRIILIYAKNRYHWDMVTAGKFLSSCNVLRVLCLVLLLPFLNRTFGAVKNGRRPEGHYGASKTEINIIRAAIVFDLVGYMGYASSPTGPFMVASGLIAAVGGIGSPTLQSAITKHIPADRIGQVMGATGLLHASARVVAPALFNVIYGLTVKFYSGIVFFCLGSVFIVVFVMSWYLKPNVYLRDSSALDEEDDQVTAS